MIKDEKIISDMELNMVVGGAAGLILKKNEDGTIDGFLVKDIETDMITSGSEITHYKEKQSGGEYTNIDPAKLDDFIDYIKGSNPDVKVIWNK